jgi:hypothetical protein
VISDSVVRSAVPEPARSAVLPGGESLAIPIGPKSVRLQIYALNPHAISHPNRFEAKASCLHIPYSANTAAHAIRSRGSNLVPNCSTPE